MKIIYSYLIILIVLVRCNRVGKEEINFPEIIVETNYDTLAIGETYRAKIYLSDESFYRMKRNGKENDVLPMFRINGEIKDSDKKFYLHEEKVDEKNLNARNVREWSCGIIFPHPTHGDVEISLRKAYLVR